MFQSLKNKFKDQKGLTLIELLAVIVILGIVAAIAVPSVMKIIDNTKKDSHVSNAQLMVNVSKTAASENNLSPTTTDPIYLTLDFLEKKEYIELPKDPDGNNYVTDTYNATAVVGTGSEQNPQTPATNFLTAPSANSSYVKIELVSGKIKYSVRLYGSKRNIPLTEASALKRDLVAEN